MAKKTLIMMALATSSSLFAKGVTLYDGSKKLEELTGLKDGDTLLSIDGKEINGIKDAIAMFKKQKDKKSFLISYKKKGSSEVTSSKVSLKEKQ